MSVSVFLRNIAPSNSERTIKVEVESIPWHQIAADSCLPYLPRWLNMDIQSRKLLLKTLC